MKRLFYILFGANLLLSYPLQAQTPYDSFSPETWRPMLDLGVFEHDDETYSEPDNQVSYDTILCAAVIDRQEQMLLLVDVESLSVLAFAPLNDDLHKWISPDPLLDKYIHSTPYIYCNGNPITFVDPDGRKVGITGAYNNEDGTTSSVTFYYDEVDGVRGFYHNGQRLDTEFANKATEAIGKIHDGGKYGKMLVDGVVKDDRTIYLRSTTDFEKNRSLCAKGILQWMANDYSSRDLTVPSFITLSHEFAHFISSWYGFADYDVWFFRGQDIITNDEKWVVNVENLIRNENHLEPRQYYIMPKSPGESGKGKIPQWDGVKNVLEVICKF